MRVIHQRYIKTALICLSLICAHVLHAQTPVPHFITHEGQLTGANATFTGATGKFKFALVDAASIAFWKNDDFAGALAMSGQPAVEPAVAITLPVVQGTYIAYLGSSPTPWITYSVFSHAGLKVRTWFSLTGNAGSFVLQPDTAIPAVGYAMQIPDGTITTAKIVPNAVTSTQIANGAVGLGKIGIGAVTSSNIAPNSVAVGNLLTLTSPASGQLLSFNGTSLKWTAPAGGWALNGTNTFYNGGNVGIGTNLPDFKLVVADAGVAQLAFSGTYGIRSGYLGNGTEYDGGDLKLQGGWALYNGGRIRLGGGGRADADRNVIQFLQNSVERMRINDGGNVGIGTTTPTHRLAIAGGPPFWTSEGWGGSVELGNGTAIAWGPNAANQLFGLGHSTSGGGFFRTVSPLGTTTNPPIYDLFITDAGNVGVGTASASRKLEVRSTTSGLFGGASTIYGFNGGSGAGVEGVSTSGPGVVASSTSGKAIYANGNVQQQRDKGGFAKAMIFVKGDGTIIRGYNSFGSDTFPYSFSVEKVGTGVTVINFGFKVDDRFLSVFPANGTVIGVLYGQGPEGNNPNKIWITTTSATDMTVIVF